MTSTAGPDIHYRRYRAPPSAGETFSDPPLDRLPQQVQDNAAQIRSTPLSFADQPVPSLANAARAELLELAGRYTATYRSLTLPAPEAAASTLFLVTGHQPRLFHPGVWYKNFVLSRLAAHWSAARDRDSPLTGAPCTRASPSPFLGAPRAVAIHIIIDNDTVGPVSIRVPAGSLAEPHLETMMFDRAAEDIPFEERQILDPDQFASFGAQVTRALRPILADPLIASWWPSVVEASRRVDRLGLALAQARHRLEASWGLETLELPLSHVCATYGFRLFVLSILDDLARFRRAYNEALSEYRCVNKVRSRSHPVPPLEQQDEWLEAPFWIWTRDQPRRRRLFVRLGGGRLELTDREQLRLVVDAPSSGRVESAVADLAAWEARGIKLRPRALMTTLYARLVLCDLFVHGIGGGKYDQLTDAISQRFFGTRPPPFLVLSATLRLPIRRPTASEEERRAVERSLRDLEHNPDRHITITNDTCALVNAKRQLLAEPPPLGQRAAWHARLKQANAALQPFVQAERERLAARRDELRIQLRDDRLLASREFAFCLFPVASLLALLLDK